MPYDNIENIWRYLLIKADISLVSDFWFKETPRSILLIKLSMVKLGFSSKVKHMKNIRILRNFHQISYWNLRAARWFFQWIFVYNSRIQYTESKMFSRFSIDFELILSLGFLRQHYRFQDSMNMNFMWPNLFMFLAQNS